VLFLDDVSANIDAAKSLGMKTLKVINPVQSLSAMETILMQGT
jgi:methionine salvage enolase-phosphatase E1